jgi:hypothetical protein
MEEKRLVQDLLAHPKDSNLTLSEAQSFACQLAMDIIKENSHYEMSCVQIEWFYGNIRCPTSHALIGVPSFDRFSHQASGHRFEILSLVQRRRQTRHE